MPYCTTFSGPVCGCMFAGIVACSASGQDALRMLPPVANESFTNQQVADLENQPYNARLGDFKLLARPSFETEWNDNINLVNSHPEQDFIARPEISVRAWTPVTDLNAFNLSIGLGYEAYVEHSSFSRLLITPASALSWDFFVKNIQINIHDRFTYENDPSLYGNIGGSARVGGLFNTAGLSTIWELSAFRLLLGFDHLNFISSTSTLNTPSYRSEFATTRMEFRINPELLAGPEAAGGPTYYGSQTLSDFINYSAGAFCEWTVGSHFAVHGRGGYLEYLYALPSLVDQHSRVSSYYLNLTADHKLTRHINYGVQCGHEAVTSIDGALIQQWYASLYCGWDFTRYGVLNADIRYEDARQAIGVGSPTYDRVISHIGFSHPITRRLEAKISCEIIVKGAEVQSFAYKQDRVQLNLTYHF